MLWAPVFTVKVPANLSLKESTLKESNSYVLDPLILHAPFYSLSWLYDITLYRLTCDPVLCHCNFFPTYCMYHTASDIRQQQHILAFC
jgi:hypothetical protein